MGLFKKLPWGNGSQRTATFDPSDFNQKQHLDLVFRLAKQAFQIRFLNEKLVENNQSQPQAVRTTNICQQLEGGSLNIPSANQLENLVSNIFINSQVEQHVQNSLKRNWNQYIEESERRDTLTKKPKPYFSKKSSSYPKKGLKKLKKLIPDSETEALSEEVELDDMSSDDSLSDSEDEEIENFIEKVKVILLNN